MNFKYVKTHTSNMVQDTLYMVQHTYEKLKCYFMSRKKNYPKWLLEADSRNILYRLYEYVEKGMCFALNGKFEYGDNEKLQQDSKQ